MRHPLFFNSTDTLYEIYKLPIEDPPYSFFYIDVIAEDINQTFHIRFYKPIIINAS